MTRYAVVLAPGCYTSMQTIHATAIYRTREEAESRARHSGRLAVITIGDGDDAGPWQGHWLDRLHRSA